MTVLLTGATGFVGMEVLARLLEKGDEPVAALVRGGDQAAADYRLASALDLVGMPAQRRGLVRAVRGELTYPRLGLSPDDAGRVTAEVTSIVHCAASVSFGLPLAEARAINVGGTLRTLEMAEELDRRGRLERMVHVSTAYVAGRHAGVFSEDDLWVGQEFRNSYERAKAEAEAAVREFAERRPITIVRPSIVVGESDTGWTPAFNVVYPPLRAFARGLLDEIPVRPEMRVDMVPVDYVADSIVHALRVPDPPRVLHATAGPDAPTVDRLVDLTCETLERDRPAIVPPTARGASDAAYASYLDMRVVFDDAQSRSSLRPAGISPPRLEAYLDRLLAFAERARWGRVRLTRDDARAWLGTAEAI